MKSEANYSVCSIILIMPITIMKFMKFAEKCPKCGGFLQTKSVRKSIGLGFVEIPTAQFCLNPVCDWYQDFAEIKPPEEIKEGLQITKNQLIALAVAVGLIVIVSIISLIGPLFNAGNEIDQEKPPDGSDIANNTAILPDVPAVTVTSTTAITTPVPSPVLIEPRTYTIKFDASHGFYPDSVTINKSDTVVWRNEENQRPRILLVSKDNLFDNQVMQYPDLYQYQFNQEGQYTFVVADYKPYKEYTNAVGSVIVK